MVKSTGASGSSGPTGAKQSIGKCKKCKLDVFAGTEKKASQRSKEVNHRACLNAYKRRLRMNKSSAPLALAWNRMPEEEQAQWYVENAVAEEEKEDVEIEQDIAETDSDIVAKLARREAIPFSVYEREGEMRGWSPDKIEKKWKAELLEKKNKLVKYDGETLLARFAGVILDEGQVSKTSATVVQKRKINSQDDMEKAGEVAKKVLSSARESHKATGMLLHSSPEKTCELPDDLLGSLVENVDIGGHDSGFAKMIEDALSESERRAHLIAELLQKDMVAASIFVVEENAEDGKKKDTRENRDKLRIAKRAEFNKFTDAMELHLAEALSQAKEIEASAKKKLPADDKLAVPAYTTLQGVDKKLATISETYKPKIAEVEQKFDSATTLDGILEALKELKDMKVTYTGDTLQYRRAVATLRACVRKFEMTGIKGIKASNSDDSTSDKKEFSLEHPTIKYFLNVALSSVTAVNMKEFDANGQTPTLDATRMDPHFIREDRFKTMGTEIKWTGPLISWLHTQLEGLKTVSAPITKPNHLQPIYDFINEGFHSDGNFVFEKPHSVVHKELETIFRLTIHATTKEYTQFGFLPFGLSHYYFVVEGSVLLIAVKCSGIEGGSFTEKVSNLNAANGEQLMSLVKTSGFCCKAEPGLLFFVPAGYVVITVACASSTFFRWPSMSESPGNVETACTKEVLSATTLMTAAFPSLLDNNYKAWLKYLESL
mmetsp:Transcript_24545/g.39362  ORF Transcript_24545/g.39362 Transcript_24545/m.39362 type:complete len:717 (+) Transcript_24545:76-2226(+)